MKVDLRSILRSEIDWRISNINHFKDELKSAYVNDKPGIERNIFNLSMELRDILSYVKNLADELEEEINQVNKL